MAFPDDLEEASEAPSDPLMAPAPSYGGELDEDFRAAAIEAFPDLDGDDGRIAALKSMIEICLDTRGEAGGEKKSGPMPKSGSADLALVFGKGGK